MKAKRLSFIITVILLAVCVSFGFRYRKSIIDIRDYDSLRIEYVGTKTKKVKINKIKRSKGFVFQANQRIELSNGEYIKVTNKRTGATLYVCYKGFKLTGTSSVSTFIRKRFAAGKGQSDLGSILELYPWQMVNDTLRIPTIMQLDNNHTLILKTIPGNEILAAPYDTETNELVLTKDYFLEHNIVLQENVDYTFHVEYQGDNQQKALTDKFIIQYIPVIK